MIFFIGILEEEGVFVRFVKNGRPQTKFAGIDNPITVDAMGITNSILKTVKSLNNTKLNEEEYVDHVLNRLVNVNFDGAAVMSGHLTGVQARLKEMKEGLIYTHCVAHALELAVLDAIKFDSTYLETFNDNLNGIFKFYYNSAVRRQELKQIGDMFAEEFKKFGLLKKIRWIASRERALKLIETNYEIIVYDMEQKSYGTSETAKKALGYAQFMKNPKFLFYLHFLQDLVGTLKPISLKFQQEDFLCCQVPRVISEACSRIESLSVTHSESLMRLMSTLKLHDERSYDLMYKGVILDKPTGRRVDEISHTPESYEAYYVEHYFEKIISESRHFLTNRYKAFNESPLKEMVQIFDFKGWPKTFEDKRKWGLQEVKDLAEFYYSINMITEEEKNLAARQWVLFRNKVSPFRKEKLIDVYADLLNENDSDLKGMLVLLEIMMTISSSTAACERGFSCMNNQKTTLRTTLAHSTLDDIMRICIDGPTLREFNAERHVKSWTSNAKGTRHIKGHELPPPRKKKRLEQLEDEDDDSDLILIS